MGRTPRPPPALRTFRPVETRTRIGRAAGAAGPARSFSLPYARTHPEDADWTRNAAIVHLHWVSGFIDYPRFFPRVHAPMVWTLHDQQPYLGGFHYALDRDTQTNFDTLEAECLALKRATLVHLRNPLLIIGNSDWNTTAARASGFFPKDTRFETVYYPLSLHDYAPREKAAAKVALGVDPRACVVGFACTGLQNTRKGLADLLAALRIIEGVPGHQPVTLLSFGRAPTATLRATLKSRWQHLGFLDADTVKCSAYSAMDCFVIPSHAEAFGQTAIEALASGTCAPGAAVGGIPETMPSTSHEHTLFKPGDPADLSARLQLLLGSPELRTALAARGLEHVRKQHDSVAVAAQLTCSCYRHSPRSPSIAARRPTLRIDAMGSPTHAAVQRTDGPHRESQPAQPEVIPTAWAWLWTLPPLLAGSSTLGLLLLFGLNFKLWNTYNWVLEIPMWPVFADLRVVLEGLRLHTLGIDPLLVGKPEYDFDYNYPRLWLHLGHIGVHRLNLAWTGFALGMTWLTLLLGVARVRLVRSFGHPGPGAVCSSRLAGLGAREY